MGPHVVDVHGLAARSTGRSMADLAYDQHFPKAEPKPRRRLLGWLRNRRQPDVAVAATLLLSLRPNDASTA